MFDESNQNYKEDVYLSKIKSSDNRLETKNPLDSYDSQKKKDFDIKNNTFSINRITIKTKEEDIRNKVNISLFEAGKETKDEIEPQKFYESTKNSNIPNEKEIKVRLPNPSPFQVEERNLSLFENQTNFSNHSSKNFVVLKENKNEEINFMAKDSAIKMPEEKTRSTKEIISLPIRKKLLKRTNKKEIKEIFNIKYESEIIDFTNFLNTNNNLPLGNINIGKHDIEYLAKDISKEAENFQCEEFKLTKFPVSFRCLKDFSIFFLNCNTLKFLDLSENDIGDLGVRILSEAFSKKENSNISEVNLQKNSIGDKGAEILSDCIKQNTSLLKIELEHNLIGNHGGEKLLNSLKENKKIKWLNLFGNNSIDNNIITLISGQLRTNRISNRVKKNK